MIPVTALHFALALENAMALKPVPVKGLKAKVDKAGRTKLETVANPKRSVSQKIAAKKRKKWKAAK